MVMNAKIMTAIANDKLVYSDRDISVVKRKGGWVNVTRDGTTFAVRADKAREIMAGGKQRYSTVGDRLYSEWINNTQGGQMHTARRQVEGMQKKAIKNGDFEMAGALGEVLNRSDVTVAKWYDKWKATTSDKEIEEFYSYDTTQDFEDMLEELLQE